MDSVLLKAAVDALENWAQKPSGEVWVIDDKIFTRHPEGFDYIRLPKDERLANLFIDIIYPAL